MGFAENMRVLSNINCGLASMVSFGQQKNNGVDTQTATMNLFGNLANGIARNEVAYEMQRFGNPVGNTINMYAGYGNPTSNAIGTMGLMGACSPWMFFNSPSYMFSPMPMMGGFYSSMGMGFNEISITTTHHCHNNRGFYC